MNKSFSAIIEKTKNRELPPIVFLYGAEPYYLDRITAEIEKDYLQEHEKDFNLTVLYGQDTDIAQITDQARRFPMMAPRQVVIIKEAQSLKNVAGLIQYINHPTESTLLVLAYNKPKIDKRTKFWQTISKKALVFDSPLVYEDKIPSWIEEYVKEAGNRIEPEAVILLAESAGNQLSKLSNELDKLLLNATENSVITRDQVQKEIGISKDFNVFELNRKLGARDNWGAQQIVRYMEANPKDHPLYMMIPMVYNYFEKGYLIHSLRNPNDKQIMSQIGVNFYFVKEYKTLARNYNSRQIEQVFRLLLDYDLKSKGVNNGPGGTNGLMRELIDQILHVS